MKLYHIKIVDRKTNEVLVDEQKRAITKKKLNLEYTAKYRFHENVVSIEINRLTRPVGVQIDIFNIINEVENGNN
jgi:hypothetical protein